MKTVKSQFKFRGGVHPAYNKELARDKAIVQMPVPPVVGSRIPVSDADLGLVCPAPFEAFNCG